jgi:diadenosine tetraphosphate (Ap4A) HIT family hydrolase
VADLSDALPEFTKWPTFPFEGDLRLRKLDPPVENEPPRLGEDPSTCLTCSAPEDAYIWVSDRWRVRALERPTGLPMVLILESRSHLDLGDLPNLFAAELGVMIVRLERAMRSLDGVARVHVNRWGDGSAHLHLWFLARPQGRLQLRGTFLSLWDDILPPIPEDQWRENLALVAAWLAEFGGRPLAEPPRIDWKAPGTLGAAQGVSDENEGEEADAQSADHSVPWGNGVYTSGAAGGGTGPGSGSGSYDASASHGGGAADYAATSANSGKDTDTGSDGGAIGNGGMSSTAGGRGGGAADDAAGAGAAGARRNARSAFGVPLDGDEGWEEGV